MRLDADRWRTAIYNQKACRVCNRKTLISTFAIERDSILRIKIAGFVERLTVPSQINSTASILGLNSSVGEQAATNDDVTMEPATGPET
jgi:hypothetical protein